MQPFTFMVLENHSFSTVPSKVALCGTMWTTESNRYAQFYAKVKPYSQLNHMRSRPIYVNIKTLSQARGRCACTAHIGMQTLCLSLFEETTNVHLGVNIPYHIMVQDVK